MLKRIRTIQNIGRFTACSSAHAEFEKLTLVFGRNTYGKSTLCDLLASLRTSSSETIKNRKSIPVNPDKPSQLAELSFYSESSKSETPLKFTNGAWQARLPEYLNIQVFDNAFYHNNLFAGQHVTRGTKENFSAFVLGEKGVAKAQKVAEKNKQKAEAIRERNKLQRTAFSQITDFPQFLELKVQESMEELEIKRESLIRTHDSLKKQQVNAKNIREREDLQNLFWESSWEEKLNRFNKALGTSLQNHHEDARRRVAEHIKDSFQELSNAEGWIRQGINQNNGKSCQFCGQTLSDEAISLLEVYRQSFDNSFVAHERQIKEDLNTYRSAISQDHSGTLKLAIERNQARMALYVEFEDNAEYQSVRSRLNLLARNLESTLVQWAEHHEQLKNAVDEAVTRKLGSPQCSLEGLRNEQFAHLCDELLGIVSEYNALLLKMNEAYEIFKKSLQDIELTQKIEKIVHQGKQVRRMINRLELNELCKEYKKHDDLAASLAKEVPRLEAELRVEQSVFIDKFFDKLNHFFKAFGSSDFHLEKNADNSGHTPIFFLQVKFRGVSVSEKDLAHIFSESDRRALALAMFWTGLDSLTEEQRKNAIVVLDDPVTSFDNHRVTAVHQEIVELAKNVRQIIILSHFEQGLCHFLHAYRNNSIGIKLLSIVRTDGTSRIETADIEDFLRTEHEKARERIFRFSSAKADSLNVGILRIFLEMEINSRFAMQMAEVNEQNLSDRIARLEELGIITHEVAEEAHDWRLVLNPTHHLWLGNDLEDQRHTAARFMDFIYHRLTPAHHSRIDADQKIHVVAAP